MNRLATPEMLQPSPPEARPSRPALFKRLRALLPQNLELPQPTFLKVRVVTWNMHESLPKGDLHELLGEVPVDTPPPSDGHPSTSLPPLANDPNHTYHLVVIAGQECPDLSGLPRGVGSFRLGSRDKDAEKVKDKGRDKEKDKDKGRVTDWHEIFKPPGERRIPKSGHEEPALHTTGWTSILEDFFVHGSAVAEPGGRAKDRASHYDSWRVDSNADVAGCPVTGTKGPYEMLVKERLMGIYIAIFVHRDARHLVLDTTKSVVTAGLLGGRVGDKGAIGISIKIAGTTLLFVNAHLAAHEGNLSHRLANMAKIKNELAVLDDFLEADDPRKVAEDITDRFDFTFLFGDLNFRLDLSRLHADWLISRRAYAEAFTFDELYSSMQNGQAEFVGFREAPINFPPTFKYDVPRGRSRLSFISDSTVQDDDEKGVYDTSSKQRVPSWCDRILFKSTVKPDTPPAPRTTMSLLAQAWRRFRRSSSASPRSAANATAATTISGTSTTSAPSSIASASACPTMSPTDSESESPASTRSSQQQQQQFLSYIPRRPRWRARHHSIDAAALQPVPPASSRPGILHTRSAPPGIPTLAMTSSSAPLTVCPEMHAHTQVRPSTDGGDGGGIHLHRRWRLLAILSRDGETTRDVNHAAAAAAATPLVSSSGAPNAVTTAAKFPQPRKGDVVCLSYRTLDDQGMRRLEGRSDHRPVIGVYAIYI